jgi:hypothetical protein
MKNYTQGLEWVKKIKAENVGNKVEKVLLG